MGRLLLYDLTILWKGGRAAFSRKRDLLLLIAALPVVLLAAAHGASNAATTLGGLPEPVKMLLPAVAGTFVHLGVLRRLAHLETDSVVARHALRRGPRLLYSLFWNAAPLAFCVSLVAATSGSLPALILSYAAGMGAAAFSQPVRQGVQRWRGRRRDRASAGRRLRLAGENRRQRVVGLIAARTGVAGPSVAANAALFAAAGASVALLYRLTLGVLAQPGPELLAALAAALALGRLLRQHPPLLRYLLYLGVGPVRPALVPAVSACAFAAGFVAAAAALRLEETPAFAALAAAALLLFPVLLLFRALHFAIRPRRAAELAMQVDAVAILLAGFLSPPLAPLLLVARLLHLHRRAQALRHLAP